MLRFALLVLCLTAPAAAAAQNNVDPMVARAVAYFQTRLNQNDSRTTRIRSVRGEGRALILDIELLPEAAAMYGPPNVLSMLAAIICSDMNSARFFGEGRTLRVDVIREGRALGSATTDRCPGAVGQGMSAATFAAALQSFVGTVDAGVRIAAIRAEGTVVIISLDVLAGTGVTTEAAVANFMGGYCARPNPNRSFFDRGLTMRFETTVAGQGPAIVQSFARCPGT